MKWLIVAAILLFVALRIRAWARRSPVLGPVLRDLRLRRDPQREMSARELTRGALILTAFAVAAATVHLALVEGARRFAWIDLQAPFLGTVAAASLWVAVLALVAAVATALRAALTAARRDPGR